MSVPSDPLYVNQWHLNGVWGINVESAWDDWTGANVIVADFDDGIQSSHPDLTVNYSNSLDYNAETGGNSGLPVYSSDNHGTAVGGLIAAARNGIGTVGVAYEARLVSIYQDFQTLTPNPNVIVDAMEYARDNVDVMNNSWGYDQPYYDNFHGDFDAEAAAIQSAAEDGRGGLGTILVFSAGNFGDLGSDTNYHNFDNSRFIITVGGTDSTGNPLVYTTPGSSVLVAAPASGIWTTDRTSTAGYNTTTGSSDGDTSPDLNYMNSFEGTSAAAPQVSGVVALMLEANPELGWRDVQQILAYSARQTADTSNYGFNGAHDWNGGGLHFSDYSGAGLVDAHAAVRLAETWQFQRTSASEQVASATASGGFVADNATLARQFSIASSLVVERIELDLVNPQQGGHTWTGDLEISLTSPSGFFGLFVVGNAPDFSPQPNDGDDPIFFGTWTYDSVQFMGEPAGGTWNLSVEDIVAGHTGTLGTFALRIYGHVASSDDLYVYTDEFANMFAQDSAQRATLSDSDGGIDTLNASAVTGPMSIDLTGLISNIDGHTLSISAQTIEDVFAGDGADQVIGGTAANIIDGGRGSDRLYGGDGGDLLEGNRGTDTLSGDLGGDLLVGDERTDSNGSGDTLYGGAAADYLSGGAGSDVAYGDDGADWLDGGDGNDILRGGNGDDALDGGRHNDQLYGGDGADAVMGGDANDVAYGGNGQDWISGGASNDSGWGDADDDILDMGSGNDSAYGGTGDDVIVGGDGNDTMGGDAGVDAIVGGRGSDRIAGGEGNDLLSGGAGGTGDGGADVFVLATDGGQDTIADFESGIDTLDFSAFDFTDVDDFLADGGVLGPVDADGFQLVGVSGGGGALVLVHAINGSPVTADDLLFG